MARYTGAVCRLCRRENKKLFLKGERCYTDKCAVTRRATVPGQHGKARTRKASEYGVQLRAKQQARRYYGILESQFSKYFEMAASKRSPDGRPRCQTCCVSARAGLTTWSTVWASPHPARKRASSSVMAISL